MGRKAWSPETHFPCARLTWNHDGVLDSIRTVFYLHCEFTILQIDISSRMHAKEYISYIYIYYQIYIHYSAMGIFIEHTKCACMHMLRVILP